MPQTLINTSAVVPAVLQEAINMRERINRCLASNSSMWVPAEFAPCIRHIMRSNLTDRPFRRRAVSHFDTATSGRRNAYLHRIHRRQELASVIREVMIDYRGDEWRQQREILDIANDQDWEEVIDWNDFFRSKFDITVHTCNDCAHIDEEDNGNYPYGDDWVCGSCLDNNYFYHEGSDQYVRRDDEDYAEDAEDEEEMLIGGRHSGKRVLKHIPSSFDTRKHKVFLGMELEVEVKDEYPRRQKAQELYDAVSTYDDGKKVHRYINIEEDGSLTNGFEMVTGWTGLDVHAKMLRFFKTPWRGVRSHDTRTCGLHVHVSKADMTMFHGVKLSLFIHDSNNQKLVRDIARRGNANYAKMKNKKADYSWLHNARRCSSRVSTQLTQLNEERHEALNFHNEHTVEFRMFKGTLRYETQMACLEFAYACWFFSRDTGVGSLTTDEFIKFICQANNRKDTKFLRAYLREKGYVLPKSAVVKTNPRTNDAPSQPIETKESVDV